jgi:hypothetical protein
MGSSPSKNTTCIYSEWSDWGPCVNGESKRIRNAGDPANCFDVTQTQPCKEDKQTSCCNVCNNSSSSSLSYNEQQSDSNNKLSYNYGKPILLTNILIIILLVIILVRKR